MAILPELQALKNKDADATNPNIYHSIDKLDHVYDEIKQKDKEVGMYRSLKCSSSLVI